MKNFKCKNKEKRNLFNLFEIYDCCGCNKYRIDSSFQVCNNYVNIYYLDNNCFENEDIDELIAFNKKLKIILKDAIINKSNKLNDDFIFIWLLRKEEYLVYKSYELIYDLLEFENNIHILIY